MNKRLNVFFLFCRILERKDKKSFKLHICCFNFFSVFFLFNFHSDFFVLISILFNIVLTTIISFKRYNKSMKRDIFCFDFRSNFLVSISFLINIGKEMSLPGFRRSLLLKVLGFKSYILSVYNGWSLVSILFYYYYCL